MIVILAVETKKLTRKHNFFAFERLSVRQFWEIGVLEHRRNCSTVIGIKIKHNQTSVTFLKESADRASERSFLANQLLGSRQVMRVQRILVSRIVLIHCPELGRLRGHYML